MVLAEGSKRSEGGTLGAGDPRGRLGSKQILREMLA